MSGEEGREGARGLPVPPGAEKDVLTPPVGMMK